MTDKPRKSPQEKKALSLRLDCRYSYGENHKAARTSIPRRKAIENRRVRHKYNQALSLVERVDEATLDVVESSARQDLDRLGGWRKVRDAPLGRMIEAAREKRRRHVGRKLRARLANTAHAARSAGGDATGA